MEQNDQLSKLAYAITGAIFEVNHTLGCGFLEAVYQQALELELRIRKLNIDPQKHLKIYYKGAELSCDYIADIVVENQVIIELKAVSGLDDTHRAQILNYLKATSMPLGILVNFGTPRAEIERYENWHLLKK